MALIELHNIYKIYAEGEENEVRALAVNRAKENRWVEYGGKTVEIPAESAVVLA